MAPQTIDTEYDIVFAGGGTTACIVAARLANAAPDLKILLLESGPTTKGKMEHIQPGQYITHLLPTSKTMQFYKSKSSEHTGNRSLVVQSAMCVGGGNSSVHLINQALIFFSRFFGKLYALQSSRRFRLR